METDRKDVTWLDSLRSNYSSLKPPKPLWKKVANSKKGIKCIKKKKQNTNRGSREAGKG